MKFSKPGRIVLALLVTLGVSLGITSCSSDYTIGFLYVTGTSVDNSASGQVSAFKISNNTGALTPVAGSPFSSSGQNPRRALIYNKSARFFYVLNGGDATTGAGGGVALFFIGGAGNLSYQATYTSQGVAPQTIVSDAGGNHLYVVDKYEPTYNNAQDTTPNPTPCVGPDGVPHSVGAITVFNVDSSTGRLSLVPNTQQSDPYFPSPSKPNLTYFPVGCFPIDAANASSYIYTVDRGTTGGADANTIFIYNMANSGQLVLTANSVQSTTAINPTALVASGTNVYLLDAGADPTAPGNLSYIFPYTSTGSGGALSSGSNNGKVQNDPNVQDPVAILVEASTHSFIYVANEALISTAGTAPYSSISAFNQVSGQLTLFAADEPFPTGASPRCIVEDPSNQYIYTANHDSNTVTGHLLDTVHGTLQQLRHNTTAATGGNPTWCLTTGRLQ